MELQKINKIRSVLESKHQNIVIVTHVNPDGDAIGSSLGLYEFLSVSGYGSVNVITPNDFPYFLKWIPGNDKIIIASDNSIKAKELIKNAGLIFCLDFNDPLRTDNLSELIINSDAKTILIDHHPQPTDDFDYIFSYINASSTAEIIFNLIKILNRDIINKNIASSLFTGIMTDTGSFSYGCNNPETFSTCAELIAAGINPDKIHKQVYDNYPENRIRLLGYCLREKLKIVKECNTAYIWLTLEELDNFNYRDGDTEGVVNYPLSIRNIDFAALFIEKEDHIKLSLRSVGNIDVNTFARKYFNGGGHKNAAGGKYYHDIKTTIKYFESKIAEFHKDMSI